MEKLKTLVNEHKDKLNYVVLGCAGLAAFNCLIRPDFNLIIYLYVYYVWYMFNENKVKFSFI